MCSFFSFCSSLKVGCLGLLCEEVQQYPVLYDKQIKGYKEKDVVSSAWNVGKNLELIEYGKSNFILFFMLYLW